MLQVILGVIRCIPDFQKPCASTTACLRVKYTSRSRCYPVLCGHCLTSCQAERKLLGFLLLLFKISHFLFFFFMIFFSFFVNMGPYGKKTSNDTASESAQQICSPKFMHTSRKVLYQNCIKNCKISNFRFLAFFFFCSFWGRLTWESIGKDKMCDILETARRRAKRTKIWTSGVST